MSESDLPPLIIKSQDEDSEIEAVTSTCTCSRFEDLNLPPKLIKGLYEEMKFERACNIQSICLPMILTPPPYNNLLVRGCYYPTGKTTCLVLAMLARVDPNLSAPQALCICATTEIAIQIKEDIRKMEKFTGIKSELCPETYVPVSNRTAPLTAHIIIGSPEFVDRMIAGNKLATSNLKIVVFDDTYLTLGGRENVSVRIIKEIVTWSPKCQVLVFSCLLMSNDYTVKAFVSAIVGDLFVKEFHELTVDEEAPLSFDFVKQYTVNVVDDEPSKIRLIKDKIMGLGDRVRQTIIYVGKSETAKVLHEAFFKDGYAVTTSLDPFTLGEEERRKKNKEFKDGSIQVLIAYGVVSSSGFDLSQVNLVINYHLPVDYGFKAPRPNHEAYSHRLGTAGQFGRKAALFNFVCGDEDRMIMEKIVRHSNYHVTELPSLSSDEDFKDALKKAGLMQA